MDLETELETEPQPKPQKAGPRTLSQAERDHRRALLERQQIAWQRGERMTDQDCAEALGISRNTWVAWKSAQRRKQRQQDEPKAAKAAKAGPAAKRSSGKRSAAATPAGLDPKVARQMLLEMFDRGQAAIDTLEQIRELIDDVLGPKRDA
jgi:hypothetical protein